MFMRVLLVEDERGVAGFIKKGLEEELYGVDVAVDGDEALSLADTTKYDLIILDIMLPGINGIELCRKIRQKGIQTPIMMLTARDSVGDKVLGLDSGADDYLTKPFLFDEFLARVRALLRRKSTDISELQCKDLRIDVQSHRTYVGNKELLLRPKEFALLEYLLRNKGRVLSRTQILENIWGYNYDPTTNIIDVHVKALREKISRICTIEYIRTVRGIGYIIEDR
jgi:DNA-binding response OmpR family regulator